MPRWLLKIQRWKVREPTHSQLSHIVCHFDRSICWDCSLAKAFYRHVFAWPRATWHDHCLCAKARLQPQTIPPEKNSFGSRSKNQCQCHEFDWTNHANQTVIMPLAQEFVILGFYFICVAYMGNRCATCPAQDYTYSSAALHQNMMRQQLQIWHPWPLLRASAIPWISARYAVMLTGPH